MGFGIWSGICRRNGEFARSRFLEVSGESLENGYFLWYDESNG